MSLWKKLLWIAVTLLGLASLAVLALSRGEQISALWIIVAGLCGAAISYRFYSKWLAAKVLVLNDERATPAIVRNDGKDFVPTNRWMVFGHHFAAIAGPGPLVGPVLAAQFGFLPGTLWILIGATLGGAVHDMIVLFAFLLALGIVVELVFIVLAGLSILGAVKMQTMESWGWGLASAILLPLASLPVFIATGWPLLGWGVASPARGKRGDGERRFTAARLRVCAKTGSGAVMLKPPTPFSHRL